MKRLKHRYLKVLLVGGLVTFLSTSSIQAENDVASVDASPEPWYQEYIGLPVADVNGNIIGKTKSISMSPIRTPAAKLVVALEPNKKSPHEKMFVPLNYVGYFKEEGKMKLLKPIEKIDHSLAMLGMPSGSIPSTWDQFVSDIKSIKSNRWDAEKVEQTILM